jgi:ABC-type nitrate/sulfonate/bicarbonate transport system ATPase subunit
MKKAVDFVPASDFYTLADMSSIQLPLVSVRATGFGIDVPAISLEAGEIMGIFGKSGSGKTTYLKRVREHFSPERVLYMSQFDSLLEEITIRQNMELGLACSAKPVSTTKNWEKDYANILQEFEVDRHLNKLPRQMSGGQRKRAEIVRCLMMDPEILLLDEPFQGIGHLFEAVSTKYILERAEKKHGVTVIVSHDFDLLCRFSKKILLVDDKGVIEMIPTGDPSWKPANLRAAWTLGVENLVPDQQGMVAFWARQGHWNGEAGDFKLVVPRSNIGSQRTFQRHGDTYTQVEATLNNSHTPQILIAKGAAATSGDLTLSVREHWTIENNEKTD